MGAAVHGKASKKEYPKKTEDKNKKSIVDKTKDAIGLGADKKAKK